eukprot:1281641-Prymnesium_polylepis.1
MSFPKPVCTLTCVCVSCACVRVPKPVFHPLESSTYTCAHVLYVDAGQLNVSPISSAVLPMAMPALTGG